jgi:predicted ATPase/DNA-binding SARP family transcriptional activator/DNA-binding CsgD family transcriptional regulator
MLRVWLLGGFRVSVGTRTVEEGAWRLRKAAALVKLLALAPGHRIHREQAMDLLWSELGLRAASNNLHQALYVTRRTLHPDPAIASRYLSLSGEQLALCPEERLWVDVEAFEEAAATAHRSREPAAYRAAIELYSGELLPEDRYEQWAELRREELSQLHLALLIELAGLYEERGEFKPAIEALRKTVVQEPTNEEAQAGLMRLYALCGQRQRSLEQYERLREVLQRELGAEPGASVRALKEEIAAGRVPPPKKQPSDGPPQEGTSDAGKHNLPTPRTSFVGREKEVLEVKRALAMTRLLTLTGAGGSGKTRLAFEVARDLVGSYPDGVWLVELAGLSEGELVPQTVAGALGLKERPGEPLTNTLKDHLRDKQTLLVLDNCEHLVDAAARLIDELLESCPRLRVLATSREALDVAGEVRWLVPSLSVPDPRRPPTVDELEGYESARLFVERASNRRPGFALTPENVRAVAELCWRLEGIPLAIELAAARVGALSVEQIAERLGDSLNLLTGGGRTVTPRQQTLRGTMDWSYELLGELERTLFRRLSVFAGGWSLEAAEAVASGEGIEKGEVLDLLSELVEKSLVVAEPTPKGGVRYRMLEPVRQYAREKLEKGSEAEAVNRRHAEFFLALAEEAEPRWGGPEETAWLDLLEADHDNLRVTLAWTLEHGEAETPLQLAGALWWFWEARGHVSEATKWLEEALAMGGVATTTARARVLMGLGFILRRSNIERAQACLEVALSLYEELGERRRVAESLSYLAWVVGYRGDAARSTTLYEESLTAARESGHLRVIPWTLNGLAYSVFEGGDFERAQELWGEALALARKQGSVAGASGVLFNMGYTELVRGDHERAATLLEESLTLSQEVVDKSTVSGALLGLGIAATLRDEPEHGKVLLKESLAIDVELGSKIDIAEDLEGLAEAAGALGQHFRAARLWGAAAALREDIGVPWRSAERLLHELQLAVARSELDETVWERAFAEGRAMGMEEAVEYAISEEQPGTPSTTTPEQPSGSTQATALTRREREVAALLARGLTNRQIAKELSISEHTVENHVARILKKLKLSSRSEVAAWVEAQRS